MQVNKKKTSLCYENWIWNYPIFIKLIWLIHTFIQLFYLLKEFNFNHLMEALSLNFLSDLSFEWMKLKGNGL